MSMHHTREAFRRQFNPWVLLFWLCLLSFGVWIEMSDEPSDPHQIEDVQ